MLHLKIGHIVCVLSTFILFSCEKLIEVDKPITKTVRETVFADNLTASAAMSGVYSNMTFALSGENSLAYLGGLSSDELSLRITSQDAEEISQNSILATNGLVNNLWQSAYKTIYNSNAVIEGLSQSTTVDNSLKKQLIGEAKTLRAFCHMYLTNVFGPIPYVETTDYLVNSVVARLNKTEVFDKIVLDLSEAMEMLSDDYSYSNFEKVRVNKWVASALLARAFLYMKEWEKAELFSSNVISNAELYSLDTLNGVFLKNSKEGIWQLANPSDQLYTSDAAIFIQPQGFVSAVISNELSSAFENADNRIIAWLGLGNNGSDSYFYPFKYKENADNGTGVEYYMMIRLAEMYLIRAEARAHLNNLTGYNSSESDINMIRNRAGLPNTTAFAQQEFLEAIMQERRVELFVEFGHRWVDLIRIQHAGQVLSPLKSDWTLDDTLYPIPYSELLVNPKLTQNKSY